MISHVVSVAYLFWTFATCGSRFRYRKIKRICLVIDVLFLVASMFLGTSVSYVTLLAIATLSLPLIDWCQDFPRIYLDD